MCCCQRYAGVCSILWRKDKINEIIILQTCTQTAHTYKHTHAYITWEPGKHGLLLQRNWAAVIVDLYEWERFQSITSLGRVEQGDKSGV